jgi:hypothetical protein
MNSISISDVEIYLKSKLKKPLIANPAIYVNSGFINPNTVPYEIVDKSVFPEFISNTESFKKIKVLSNKSECDYYIINKDYKNENRCKFSKNNHLSFGYGLTALPNLPKLPFIEKFSLPDNTENLIWWEECKKSAIDIKSKYKDIFLCFSGGIDSELMGLAFIDAKVDFIGFSLIYKHKDRILNHHDVINAINFCKKYNIKHITKEVKILEDLYENRHREYFINGVYETYFLIPGLYTHQLMIEYINSIGAVPVMASDQVEIKFNKNKEPVIGDCSYSIGLSAPTWAHITNKTCIYDFFMYSPEQIYAFLDIDDVKNTKTVDYNFKFKISKTYGNTNINYYNKLTGYEFIKENFKKYFNKELHELTMQTINDIDWNLKPMTQYVHPIKDILTQKSFNNWEIIRTTSNDFLTRGFDENDTSYYEF